MEGSDGAAPAVAGARDEAPALDEVASLLGRPRLTVSGGVAGVAEIGPDYEALHSAADAALYAAKRNGRDRVAVHRRPPPIPQRMAAAV